MSEHLVKRHNKNLLLYLNTVGQHGSEAVIRNYVKNQGKQYKQIFKDQLKLF